MKRGLWIAAAVAVALGVIWWAVGGERRTAPADRDAAGRTGSETAARGQGGVASRDADLSAAATVRGQVVDEDGAPIDGGTLQLSCLDGDAPRRGPVLEIGADGDFEGLGCRAVVCAELNHPYLVPAHPWVLRPGAQTVLRARGTARLHGEVRAAGAPVPNARVSFLPPDGEVDPTASLPMRVRSTSTDADGRWSVALIERPPCTPCAEARGGCPDPPVLHHAVDVAVFGQGFAAVTVPWHEDDTVGRTHDDPWRITLPAAQDLLTGRLVDAAGETYARAYVLARSLDRPHEQHRADVDAATGDFEVDGLGEGAYSLRALQDGVELAAADGAAGDDVELTGSPTAGGPDLLVTVLRGGKAVAHAVVDGGPFRADRTDMKGQVSASAVLPGTIALRVRAPGAPGVRHEITIDASDGEVRREVVELPAP